MSPLNKKTKNELSNRLAKAINNVLDAPELDELTDKQIEAIAKKYYIDELTKDFSAEIEKAKLTEDKLQNFIDDWLDGFSSKETKRNFKYNLNLFIKYLKSKRKSILDVNAKLVDKYVASLKDKGNLSNSTIRQRIASCSSFWSSLERWEIVNRNPFKGVKNLPKKEISVKQSDEIPTNDELDLLEVYARELAQSTGIGSHTKIQGGKKALCTIKCLRETGLRIGALQNLKIDTNGYYQARSKGSIAQGRISNELLNIFIQFGLSKKEPFKDYSSSAFQMWLWRALTSPEMRDKIKRIFSCHSIRHRFSIDFYNETKDVHELSKRLGHSSLLVTTAYLSGLQSELADN